MRLVRKKLAGVSYFRKRQVGLGVFGLTSAQNAPHAIALDGRAVEANDGSNDATDCNGKEDHQARHRRFTSIAIPATARTSTKAIMINTPANVKDLPLMSLSSGAKTATNTLASLKSSPIISATVRRSCCDKRVCSSQITLDITNQISPL